jgi:mRNA-degrading endonuclease RelE of RelBE toxin-antitoxin system
MPAHRLVWLEVAERQYLDLPDQARDQVDQLLSQLEQAPTHVPGAVFDQPSDQWSAPLGDFALVLYAVVPDRATVIILRIIHLDVAGPT